MPYLKKTFFLLIIVFIFTLVIIKLAFWTINFTLSKKIYIEPQTNTPISAVLEKTPNSDSGLKNNEPKEEIGQVKNNSITLSPPKNGLYLGAFADFGQNEDQVTKDKINNFQTLINKKIAWAYFSNNWFEGINFPKKQVEILREFNITPYIRLMPRKNFSNKPSEQKYTLERIINGDFDSDLENWAKMAKESNLPMILEFGTEVNGDWFPWNGKWNGQGKTDGYGNPALPDGPEKFIDAYRHIINIFRDLKVNNVTWVYHISAQNNPKDSWNDIMSYYPGDLYIDWIGVSVYGSQNPNEKLTKFNEVFNETYQKITSITNKPIAIVEFGATEGNKKNKKADWLNESLSSLCANNYPNVKGLAFWHSSWFNKNGTESNLRVDSSASALTTLNEFLASDCFKSDSVFINSDY